VSEITIPDRMRDLKRHGDMAVGYYFEWVDAANKVTCQSRKPPVKPDFRVVCPARWSECVVKGLCCLCGKPLDPWLYLVSDIPTADNRLFPDPAMHHECALYAIRVCPFLLGTREHRRERMPDGSERFIERIPAAHQERPIAEVFYLVKVREQWPFLPGQSKSYCIRNRAAICAEIEAGRVPLTVAASIAVASEEFRREHKR
jgi:hypothetical protein